MTPRISTPQPIGAIMSDEGMTATTTYYTDMVMDVNGNPIMSVAGSNYLTALKNGDHARLRQPRRMKWVIQLDDVRIAMYTELQKLTKGKFKPDHNTDNYTNVCKWVQAVINAETTKGLWIWSEAFGNGKTTVAQAAVAVINWARTYSDADPFKIHYSDDIADEIRTGEKGAAIAHHKCYGGDIFLDDVSEKLASVTHYGNNIMWVSEVVMKRYRRFENGAGLMIATSNIPYTQLHEHIDPRACDRMNKMFIFMHWNGSSNR